MKLLFKKKVLKHFHKDKADHPLEFLINRYLLMLTDP